MTKNLTDKLGFNGFHNDGITTLWWKKNGCDKALDFCVKSGVKYFRPAFRLLDDEWAGTPNNWRVEPFKEIINVGITPILNLLPAALQGHLKDDNADELVGKAVSCYATVLDEFIDGGLNPEDIIIEAWNEADGIFSMNDGSSQTDINVINRYLTFNMKMNEECHKRGFRFMDLDSVCYPKAPELQTVMNQYNQKMASYSSKPDWVSYHPYCERKRDDNNIPEKLLVNNNMNLSNWDNLSDLPIAVSEFGYPTEDWGNPFSGQYPYQYSKDMFVRQVIIMDYLNVDPIVIYSANVNPDPSDAGKDECWGTFQYHKDSDTITLSTLGSFEYYWIKNMQGYHLNGMVTPSNNFALTNENVNYTNFAFEYINDETGHKKLFYWNPMGYNTSSLNWNNQTYNLTFTQHVKSIES